MKNNVILIVDDIEINRDMLVELFKNDYEILEAENGEQAMKLIREHGEHIIMVLLDIIMPVKDGYDVLDFMRFHRYNEHIPVILISGKDPANTDTKDSEIEGLKRGANDFIYKPFNPIIVKQRVRNIIDLFRYKQGLERTIADKTDKLTGVADFVMNVLLSVTQRNSAENWISVKRVQSYTRAILNCVYEYSNEKYGLEPQIIDLIATASLLKDIGELPVFDEDVSIAEKKKNHTERGCKIINSIKNFEDNPYTEVALEICKNHHERWDGSGFPNGLSGDTIPLSAQAVGLADTYESLRNGSLTGRRYSGKDAVNAIARGDFGMFSPVLTESCKLISDKLDEIFEDTKTV